MRTLFLLLFINSSLFAYCQQQKIELQNPERLGFKEIRLNAQRIAPADIKLPFSSIKIVDSRFDTTKLGFLPVTNLFSDKHDYFKKLSFKEGSIAESLAAYYNDYYKNSFLNNGFELLIVMKRFWISGIDYTRSKRVDLANNLYVSGNLYCKWEYYFGKQGKYLPVKRLDTIMQSSEDQDLYIDEEFHERRLARFKFCLKALVELFDFERAVALFDKQPGKSMNEIISYNNKRNDIKILRDSSFQKGVYLSFDEFRNNKPSITEYKEKQTKYGLFKSESYLVDAKGDQISEYWGYSDGEKFRFGKFGNDKIYRVENTFEFFVQVVATEYDNSTPVATRSKFKAWMPYQIDMETGLIY